MASSSSIRSADEEKAHVDPAPHLAPKHKKYNRVLAGILCAVISLLALGLGIGVGFGERIPEFNDPTNSYNGRTVSLYVSLLSADPVAGTVGMMWSVLNDTCITNGTNTSSCTPVNIFFDPNLLTSSGSGSAPASVNDSSTPIFIWDPSIFVNDVHASFATFRTTLLMFTLGATSSLQEYPFDKYGVYAYMYANDAQSNATVGLVKQYSSGTVAGLKLSVIPYEDDSGSINEQINVARGGLVIAYTILLVVVVWIITLVFVWSTISLLCGYAQPIELLLVPVATLFTITQLRGTMPGAPAGFGATVDYVGLLPCLALMSFCAATTLGYVVFFKARKSKYTWLDGLSYKVFDRETSNPHGRSD